MRNLSSGHYLQCSHALIRWKKYSYPVWFDIGVRKPVQSVGLIPVSISNSAGCLTSHAIAGTTKATWRWTNECDQTVTMMMINNCKICIWVMY